MIPLAIIRPDAVWQRTVDEARGVGLRVIGEPLFVDEPVAWTVPAHDEIDALLIASANAVRLAGPQLASLANLPVYAVGSRTADAVRAAGFDVAYVGDSDLQSIADVIDPLHRRLLRIVGRHSGFFRAPPHASVIERVVYDMTPQPIGEGFAAQLQKPAVVAVHSGNAARHFGRECDRLAIDRSLHTIAAFSPRIARAAGTGWRAVRAAASPTGRALLALAGELCQ